MSNNRPDYALSTDNYITFDSDYIYIKNAVGEYKLTRNTASVYARPSKLNFTVSGYDNLTSGSVSITIDAYDRYQLSGIGDSVAGVAPLDTTKPIYSTTSSLDVAESFLNVLGFLYALGVVQVNTPPATLNPNSVTNVILANMPALTLKGNNAGTTGDPKDLTVAQVKSMLNYILSEIVNAGDIKNYMIANNEIQLIKLTDITGPAVIGKDSGTGSPVVLDMTTLAAMLSPYLGTANIQSYIEDADGDTGLYTDLGNSDSDTVYLYAEGNIRGKFTKDSLSLGLIGSIHYMSYDIVSGVGQFKVSADGENIVFATRSTQVEVKLGTVSNAGNKNATYISLLDGDKVISLSSQGKVHIGDINSYSSDTKITISPDTTGGATPYTDFYNAGNRLLRFEGDRIEVSVPDVDYDDDVDKILGLDSNGLMVMSDKPSGGAGGDMHEVDYVDAGGEGVVIAAKELVEGEQKIQKIYWNSSTSSWDIGEQFIATVGASPTYPAYVSFSKSSVSIDLSLTSATNITFNASSFNKQLTQSTTEYVDPLSNVGLEVFCSALGITISSYNGGVAISDSLVGTEATVKILSGTKLQIVPLDSVNDPAPDRLIDGDYVASVDEDGYVTKKRYSNKPYDFKLNATFYNSVLTFKEVYLRNAVGNLPTDNAIFKFNWVTEDGESLAYGEFDNLSTSIYFHTATPSNSSGNTTYLKPSGYPLNISNFEDIQQFMDIRYTKSTGGFEINHIDKYKLCTNFGLYVSTWDTVTFSGIYYIDITILDEGESITYRFLLPELTTEACIPWSQAFDAGTNFNVGVIHTGTAILMGRIGVPFDKWHTVYINPLQLGLTTTPLPTGYIGDNDFTDPYVQQVECWQRGYNYGDYTVFPYHTTQLQIPKFLINYSRSWVNNGANNNAVKWVQYYYNSSKYFSNGVFVEDVLPVLDGGGDAADGAYIGACIDQYEMNNGRPNLFYQHKAGEMYMLQYDGSSWIRPSSSVFNLKDNILSHIHWYNTNTFVLVTRNSQDKASYIDLYIYNSGPRYEPSSWSTYPVKTTNSPIAKRCWTSGDYQSIDIGTTTPNIVEFPDIYTININTGDVYTYKYDSISSQYQSNFSHKTDQYNMVISSHRHGLHGYTAFSILGSSYVNGVSQILKVDEYGKEVRTSSNNNTSREGINICPVTI